MFEMEFLRWNVRRSWGSMAAALNANEMIIFVDRLRLCTVGWAQNKISSQSFLTGIDAITYSIPIKIFSNLFIETSFLICPTR